MAQGSNPGTKKKKRKKETQRNKTSEDKQLLFTPTQKNQNSPFLSSNPQAASPLSLPINSPVTNPWE
jgi:hypothetical protein